MSVIIIPRKHLRQPQGRADIDWANPLTDGLVRAFNVGDLRDAVRVGAAQQTGIVPAARYRADQALVVDNTTPGHVRGSVAGQIGNSLTMFAVAARTRVDNSGQGIISVGAGNQRHLLYDALNKPAMFSGNGGSFGQAIAATSIMPAVGEPFSISGRVFNSAGRDVWLNGALAATNSTETFGVTGVDTLVLGAYWDNNAASFPWSGHLWLGALWARALADVELLALTEHPWQLFRADPIRIYSLPAGPISVSWSSLTASGITPTTATLTIGGITR